MESMALGFAILAWWTWPLIVVCCVVAMIIAFHIMGWLEDRRSEKETDHGPVPCLAHMGEQSGMPVWCLKVRDHDGPCWGIESARFSTLSTTTVCLRSSNCNLPNEHDGRCVLEY